MKYILVIDHIRHGGAERILLDYYAHLVHSGKDVKIFVITGKRDDTKWVDGIDVIYGSCDDVDNLLLKVCQQFIAYRRFRNLVREVRPDVIFSFLEKSNLLTSLVSSKAVKVMTVHNVLSIQYKKIHNGLILKMVYGMIRLAYNRCSHVIAVSKQVKDDLISSFKVKKENIKIINNYVDWRDIAEKAEEPIDNYLFESDKKYILNVGRFSDQKAQWKLLKAYSLINNRHKESRLVLIGIGDNLNDLRKLSKELDIDHQVSFLPFSLNPYKYMAKVDLFALSSIFEGFPIVLAEVSSLRIPFVGSRKAIPVEMFTDESKWEEYTFECENIHDASSTIHQDEVDLAKLLERGLYDPVYRQCLLEQTSKWESHNDKDYQFNDYDACVK